MTSETLSRSEDIEVVESRGRQLLKRQRTCKDEAELKENEKQLEETVALPRRLHRTEAKISRMDNSVTQFAWAAKYGVTGLIAHDYLSGQEFYALEPVIALLRNQ